MDQSTPLVLHAYDSKPRPFNNSSNFPLNLSININKTLKFNNESKDSSFLTKIVQKYYYEYVIELKLDEQRWKVFRRYSSFKVEHDRIKVYFSGLKKVKFPEKKIFNQSNEFQIERCNALETYLVEFIKVVYESFNNVGNCSSSITKDEFCDKIKFFKQSSDDQKKARKLGWID